MMKRTSFFLVLLAILSIVSGILMSEATWISRVGITLLHKEYNFLKIWWQGAMGVYLMLMLLYAVHTFIHVKSSNITTARLLHSLLLLVALLCLFFTYNDFHHDFSHRLLGWRFHFGVYLFWIAWMMICFFFIARKRHLAVINSGRTEPSVQ
jgi:hypothetical protein